MRDSFEPEDIEVCLYCNTEIRGVTFSATAAGFEVELVGDWSDMEILWLGVESNNSVCVEAPRNEYGPTNHVPFEEPELTLVQGEG